MIPFTSADVAGAVSGHLTGPPDALVSGSVVIDSRGAGPGDLFVALPGERVDGHDFVAAAAAQGAAAVLVARPIDADVPAVIVDDVAAALGRLAHAVLARSSATVVGVTGSSGKTTTKDMLAQVLAAAGPTVAPPGSFNNELGLPLTVTRIEATTRWLALEYSARGPGHIRHLTEIAPPQAAAVLNVGHAHVGEFGGVEEVARAKGELVAALPATGAAVLNADDHRVAAMRHRTDARVLTFGRTDGSDVRLSEIELDGRGCPTFQVATAAGSRSLRLHYSGAHQAGNAAAVVSLGLAIGLDLDLVAEALEAARPVSPHRMDVRSLPGDVVIIDDAYNANPESMRAGLHALHRMSARRRWAVLGPMRELGGESGALHREVGRAAADSGIDRVIAVGSEADSIREGAASVSGWRGSAATVPDRASAADVLRHELSAGDVVLVKASNAEQLWLLADELASPSRGVSSDRPAARP
jgi:UDP-N-acetylmuramoyl-tripeptide--D-alanyl-D-alanine ligase